MKDSAYILWEWEATYLDLLWMDFLDAAAAANEALFFGNKLEALYWAIVAHKAKTKYEVKLSESILSK